MFLGLDSHRHLYHSYYDHDQHLYKFGMEHDDKDYQIKKLESDLKHYRTIDEICKEKGLKPFNKSWSTVPINDSIINFSMEDESEDTDENNEIEDDKNSLPEQSKTL